MPPIIATTGADLTPCDRSSTWATRAFPPMAGGCGSGGLDRVDALDGAGLEPVGFDDLESGGPDEG